MPLNPILYPTLSAPNPRTTHLRPLPHSPHFPDPLPQAPCLSPSCVLTKTHADIGKVTCLKDWMEIVLLSTVCFPGNMHDNMALLHLKGTAL